jgi:hypothetical protein
MTRFYCAVTTCKNYEMSYTSRPADEGNCTREDTQINAQGVCENREDIVDISKLVICPKNCHIKQGSPCFHLSPHQELDGCSHVACKLITTKVKCRPMKTTKIKVEKNEIHK